MKGRPLPGQVERPFDAPRFSPDEFAAAVLGWPAADDGDQVQDEERREGP